MYGEAVPCPFKYASGKRCSGHIVRIAGFGADVEWKLVGGTWTFDFGPPRSHYHVYCSEKGNHAGMRGSDSEQLKFWPQNLPAGVSEVMRAAPLR